MAFKVLARTIFHLGADLISSDSIALYELIKNAFDAGSPDVEIKCGVRYPAQHYVEHLPRLRKAVEDDDDEVLEDWRDTLRDHVDQSVPESSVLLKAVDKAKDLSELLGLLEDANYISVVDTGSGMTLGDLSDIYLSIGTPHRLLQKAAGKSRQILGDKGVGRLAAMRLGRRLSVTTATRADSHWNVLEVNWDDFLVDLEASIEDVEVEPRLDGKKAAKDAHGTTILITSLTSQWSAETMQELAREDIAKLADPFGKSRFPITLSYNGEGIKVPRFESVLLDYAHAVMEVSFVAAGEDSRLEGAIDYRHRKQKRAFVLRGADLLSTTGLSSFAALDGLGPFDVKLYWFNRQMLRKLEGSAELKHAIGLQERWAGGLMVYRDGFRVNPYGTGDDDWLDLDRIALASTAYKVNRRQIVGRVSITTAGNPTLVDQTNREGLRDSLERRVLVALLQHAILDEFKPFLDQCDEEAKEGVSLTVAEIEERVSQQKKRLRTIVKQLKVDYPKLAKDTDIVATIEDASAKLDALMAQARRQVESYEEAQDRVLHLAATGMLVEMLAHELNRATRHALTILQQRGTGLPQEVSGMLKTLEAQLKTLQKRLRILDPLATAGRQVKDTFDLVSWVREIVDSHAEQFRRHSIEVEVRVRPPKAKALMVKMVKGMLVQILENIFSNSVYWLGQQAKFARGFKGRVLVDIDTSEASISVTDNGPGIDPKRRESIFEPFVTTKPPGLGKGLGLFISREVAKYHKAVLELSDAADADGQFRTFTLHLGSVAV